MKKGLPSFSPPFVLCVFLLNLLNPETHVCKNTVNFKFLWFDRASSSLIQLVVRLTPPLLTSKIKDETILFVYLSVCFFDPRFFASSVLLAHPCTEVTQQSKKQRPLLGGRLGFMGCGM